MNAHRLSSVVLLAFSACHSTGVTRADDTAASMRAMHRELAAAPDKVTAVSKALDELAQDGGDMKAEFAFLGRSVDALVTHRDEIRDLRSKVAASRARYTTAWENDLRSIADADLRRRAEDRHREVVSKFDQLAREADSGRAEFEPWMQRVLDVRTYLENDLTAAGIASVRDRVREIGNGTRAVNNRIAAVLAGLDEMSRTITATRPAATSTPVDQ